MGRMTCYMCVSFQKVATEHFKQEERRMLAELCAYVQSLGNARFTVCI